MLSWCKLQITNQCGRSTVSWGRLWLWWGRFWSLSYGHLSPTAELQHSHLQHSHLQLQPTASTYSFHVRLQQSRLSIPLGIRMRLWDLDGICNAWPLHLTVELRLLIHYHNIQTPSTGGASCSCTRTRTTWEDSHQVLGCMTP